VDDDGNVYLREADGERIVGQYPDGTPEEALAYFERKYADLAGQVGLLEQRARGGAPALDVAKAVANLQTTIADAHAIGDLDSLTKRLAKLGGAVEELTEQQSADAKAALDAAIAERTAIVDEVEALAAADPAKTQWKQTSTSLDELFARWQTHQQDGPRLPKGEANELWRRFRAARATIEHNRKAFFAELDSQHRDVRARKTSLIERAEALIPQGADGVPAYRTLLDEWKLSGRAGKRNDDALWARFKAAGDAIYSAKSEVDAKENEEFQANLEAKLELLTEAEPLITATDRVSARATLASIGRRWDVIGKVPRDQVKVVEERFRKVEAAVRKLEDDHWQRNNPEKKARSEGLAAQLHAAISKLEDELADAQATGNAKKIAAAQEALDARKAWLDALG
jgi:thiamine pyrophosphokinase